MEINFSKSEFLTAFGTSSQLPESELPEIAFVGRSNVGKSSLINKLLNRKSLARVSCVPGKTATINFYSIDSKIILCDLPGYGYAKVSKTEKRRWSELIDGYLVQDRDLRLVISLIDLRHKPTKDDKMMIDFLVENEVPFIICATKSDKLSKRQKQERIDDLELELVELSGLTKIPTSAQTGEGIDILKNIILEALEDD